MGLHQWAEPQQVPVTVTDGNGLYADVIITFDQRAEPSMVKAILDSPKWYVIGHARHEP